MKKYSKLAKQIKKNVGKRCSVSGCGGNCVSGSRYCGFHKVYF